MLNRRLKRIEQQLLDQTHDERIIASEKRSQSRSASFEQGDHAAEDDSSDDAAVYRAENHSSRSINQANECPIGPPLNRRFKMPSRFARPRKKLTDEDEGPSLTTGSTGKIDELEAGVARALLQQPRSRKQKNYCYRRKTSAQLNAQSRDGRKMSDQYYDGNAALYELSPSPYPHKVASWLDDDSFLSGGDDDDKDNNSLLNIKRLRLKVSARKKESDLETTIFSEGERQQNKLGGVDDLPEYQSATKSLMQSAAKSVMTQNRSSTDMPVSKNLSDLDSLQLNSPHLLSKVKSSAMQKTSKPIISLSKVSYPSSDEESIDLLEFYGMAEQRQRMMAQSATGEKRIQKVAAEEEKDIKKWEENECSLDFYTQHLGDESSEMLCHQNTHALDETEADSSTYKTGNSDGCSFLRSRKKAEPEQHHLAKGITSTDMDMPNIEAEPNNFSSTGAVELTIDSFTSDEDSFSAQLSSTTDVQSSPRFEDHEADDLPRHSVCGPSIQHSPKSKGNGAITIASNFSYSYKSCVDYKSPNRNEENSLGWIIKQPGEKLNVFLRDNKPSFKSVFYGDKWICVNNEQRPRVVNNQSYNEILGKGQHILNTLEEDLENCRRGEKKVLRTAAKAQLLQLALSYQRTIGKWLLFVSKKDGMVDQIWEKVARYTVLGKLGCSAKVATFDPDPVEKGHVICVYVDKFYDVEDVRRVYNCLKRLGLNSKSFKLDLYTELGIKSKNKWGLPVSLFTSNTILDGATEEEMKRICERCVHVFE